MKMRSHILSTSLIVGLMGLILAGCYEGEENKSTTTKLNAAKASISSRSDIPFLNDQALDRPLNGLPGKGSLMKAFGSLPLRFEENRGQADGNIRFLARGAGYDFFIAGVESHMVLRKSGREIKERLGESAAIREPDVVHAVGMKFLDAKKDIRMTGTRQVKGGSNYFIGGRSSNWKTGIPNFEELEITGIYPGIDAVYYGSLNRIEYDLRVSPGSKPSDIRIQLSGASSLKLAAAGDLEIATEAGTIRQLKPVAYQLIDGKRKEIICEYRLTGNTLSFELGEYDKGTELVIDPLLDYSTFIGGSGVDIIEDVAIDSGGNLYLTGNTASTNFPITPGAYKTTKSGTSDAFVMKLDPTGSTLLYSTFIGSTGEDFGNSIAVDTSGNAYIAGETRANSFPTLNPRQSNYGGGASDCFVTKLNSTGNGLVYSTYHGGSLPDRCTGLVIDSSNSAFVTGRTESTNFPVVSAYQSTLTPDAPGGIGSVAIDAFVSKFSAAGNSLVYSTYLGGSEADGANAIAVDSSGNAYVTGYTHSTDFDLTNPFQSTLRDFWLSGDAFVTKLNPTGNALVYSTYIGGYQPDSTPCFPSCIYFSDDEGFDIAVDPSGSAYVVGGTQASDFPTVNAYQPSIGSGQPNGDAFLVKFNPAGNTLAFATYLGGNDSDEAKGVALDINGNIYVVGTTESTNFPGIGALQTSNAGLSDSFVSKFSSNGQSLSFSTYLGGSDNEAANAVAVDADGSIYLVGQTFSSNFPTATVLQSTNAGAGDGFVTKIAVGTGHTISGRITRPNGTPASGVTVNLTGGQNKQTTTNVNGDYSFTNLPSGRDYTLNPSSGIYTFVPANQIVTNLQGDATADFVVEVYTISGRVTDTRGIPVPLTRIDLTGSSTLSVLTDPDGNFAFINLAGGAYTLTPSKPDPFFNYTFVPPSRTFTNILSSQTSDFVAEARMVAELPALADAYVQDGTGAALNFGTATTLKSQTDSKTNNGKNFDSYLKFDLTNINRNIESARLRITASSSASGSVTTAAYSVSAVTWIGSGAGSITWNNKPARSGSPIAGTNTTVTGTTPGVYEIDLTAYIKGEKAAGRNLVSVALHNPSASTLFVTANSRENTAGQPKLVVTTTAFDNAAPTVAISAPTENASYTAPASITIDAVATDIDGSVTRVDFYDGTTLIGTSPSPVSGNTYRFNWTTVPEGKYAITAIAYDSLGAYSMAAPVNVRVGPANLVPTVAITSPPNNSIFGAGATIAISATASDTDGSITQVEFLRGASVIGTATVPTTGNTYSVNWTNPTIGSHSITARATDNSGGQGTSAPITVKVVGLVGLSPTADAYVQDGASASTNFGTATEVRSQVSATAGSNRETYLKFDITSASVITKATLRIYGNLNDASGTNVQFNAFPVATTTWVESGSGSLTWNNKPAAGGTALASTVITNNSPRWYDLDLTSYLQAEKTAGRNTVCIAIKGNAVSSPYARFNSREAAGNQPQLILLTTQAPDVLFAVGSTSLTAADTAIRTRLQNLGYTVTLKVPGSNANSAIKATDADGKVLVVVSATVTAANVTNKLRNIPVPVINAEFDIADDFGMTGTVSGTDFGTTASQTQAAIALASHPLSGGLSGTVSLVSASSTFSWGKPNANVAAIASLTGDPTRFVIYGYDVDASMVGIDAPSRRIGIFLSDTTAASLTANGGLLFDAAVRWATGVNTLPFIANLNPSSGAVGTQVSITGINFGTSQSGSSVTFNGLPAAVVNWSSTGIVTSVPNGATTGPVIVTVNGLSSNSSVFTVVTPNGDSDGDGLADSWEMAFFGSLSYGANDDPDGDGVSNLNEFLQGRDPTKGAVSNPSAVDLKVFTPLKP